MSLIKLIFSQNYPFFTCNASAWAHFIPFNIDKYADFISIHSHSSRALLRLFAFFRSVQGLLCSIG